MPIKKPKDKIENNETPIEVPSTVKMVRKGRVFDAPSGDIPNMLKNGWVIVDEEALSAIMSKLGKEIVNLALSKT